MTNELFSTLDKCRLCGNALSTVLKGFSSLPVVGVYVEPDLAGTASREGEDPLAPLSLARCNSCGLVQLLESLSSSLYQRYPFIGGVSSTYRRHLEQVAEHLSLSVPQGARIMELGCGDGTLLALLLEKGFKVAGFEPAEGPADIARKKGLEIVVKPFSKNSADQCPFKTADVLVARHVLEHIACLESFFEGIEQITSDGSVLVIEVPNLASTTSGRRYGNIYHAHSSYFDIESLERLLDRHGWNITEAGVVDVFGGSLLVSAARNSRNAGKVFGKTPVPTSEEELGNFIKGWDNYLVRIRAFFEDLAQKHMNVDGYGAGERTVVTIGTAGLDARHVRQIYDKNSLLHGLALPGSRIPVREPARLASDMPDALAVFASSHEEEIIAEQSAYENAGGRFITMRTSPPRFISGG